MIMFDKIYNFENLYKAHVAARRGKRTDREVIAFEMNLADNLTRLSKELKSGEYEINGYYNFTVHDPKTRVIHALHYEDRVVQHCVCDEVLAPVIDKLLIYDNAACRIKKGTHFSIKRLNGFIRDFYKKYGLDGYFLKCDIRKFFDNIDHSVLKNKLRNVFSDNKFLSLLFKIIDSYETVPGKGLPLGNQTSQWFAIYYLDGIDRLIKERLHIKFYTRYMDDFVLLHHDKAYLKKCLQIMEKHIVCELGLTFNEKTKIFPIKNGVEYLGWHFYLFPSGKILRKVKSGTKRKFKRKVNYFAKALEKKEIDANAVYQSVNSYCAHLSFGHTRSLKKTILKKLRPFKIQ